VLRARSARNTRVFGLVQDVSIPWTWNSASKHCRRRLACRLEENRSLWSTWDLQLGSGQPVHVKLVRRLSGRGWSADQHG